MARKHFSVFLLPMQKDPAIFHAGYWRKNLQRFYSPDLQLSLYFVSVVLENHPYRFNPFRSWLLSKVIWERYTPGVNNLLKKPMTPGWFFNCHSSSTIAAALLPLSVVTFAKFFLSWSG